MADDQPTNSEAPTSDFANGAATGDDLVTVSTFQTASAAQPLRIALEEAGIPVFVADDNTVTVNWLWGPALGYVKVQVPRVFGASAVEVAKQHVPVASDNADKTTDEDRPTTCLACGADMPADSDVCPKCGWTFNVPDEDEAEEGAAAAQEVAEPTKCLKCGATMSENGDYCPQCGWTFREGAGEGGPAGQPLSEG